MGFGEYTSGCAPPFLRSNLPAGHEHGLVSALIHPL
jgi:hypothetical protein